MQKQDSDENENLPKGSLYAHQLCLVRILLE
jgi:hypothetical protein